MFYIPLSWEELGDVGDFLCDTCLSRHPPETRGVIYNQHARYVLRKAREHGLKYLLPLTLGELSRFFVEAQAGFVNSMAKLLAEDRGQYYIGIYADFTLDWYEMFDFKNQFIDDPDEVLLYCEEKLAAGLKEVRQIMELASPDVVVMWCDHCSIDGPFEPPWVMEKFIYPFLRRQIEAFKGIGIKQVIKHTDGNILKGGYLEALIQSGVDLIQIEPEFINVEEAFKLTPNLIW